MCAEPSFYPIAPHRRKYSHFKARYYSLFLPAYNPLMVSPAIRLIKIGVALLTGSVAAALLLIVIDANFFLRGSYRILIFTIPLSILAVLVGVARWALHAPARSPASLGVSLLGLALLAFLLINKVQFGFDDPRVIFAALIAGTPVLVGTLLLVSAGIHLLRAAHTKTVEEMRPKGPKGI